MFGDYFYHEKIRKCVAIFGRMFNDIYVIRKNSSGGGTSQLKVPLSYAPKRKYLDRINENNDLIDDTKVAIKLPRMSFEITNFAYDASRQLTKTATFNTVGTDLNNRQKFFPPVPYTINFQLNVYAKSQDDALQIVEQILPYFNPQYTVSVKPFYDTNPELKEDVPIMLGGVSFSDDFEGSVGDRRTIIYTLSFNMKVNFYGPKDTRSIIREVHQNLYMLVGDSDREDFQYRLKTTPTPSGVSADSDYGFNLQYLDSAI